MGIPIYCYLKTFQLYYLDSVLPARWCFLPPVYTCLKGVALAQHSEATLTPGEIHMFKCVCPCTLFMGPGGSRRCRLFNGCLCSSGPAVRREALGQAQLVTEHVLPVCCSISHGRALLWLVWFQMHRIEGLVSPEQFLPNIRMFCLQHFYIPSVS